MHIPRQYAPAQRALTPDAQQHREHLEHLEHELRRTAYWRRLVQARLDLVVAGLLYAAPAPTPAATEGMVRTDPLRPARAAGDGTGPTDGAPLSFAAPLGLDVSYLLDGGGRDGDGRGTPATDTGTRLDRLRQVSRLLTDHERTLLAELHALAPVLPASPVTRQPVGGS